MDAAFSTAVVVLIAGVTMSTVHADAFGFDAEDFRYACVKAQQK